MINSIMGQQLSQAEQLSRAQAPKRIVVCGPDVEILRHIYSYRLSRIRDVVLLTGRTYQRLHGRLKGLFDNGYVGRTDRRWAEKDVYYIRQKGLAVLLREGLITDEEAHRRVREGELKDHQFLRHELLVSDIHMLLELATRKLPLELSVWKQGREIHDSFEAMVDGELQTIDIEPDAFFTLRETSSPEGRRNTFSFLLEADRGTMPKKERAGSRRMDEKLRKYTYYIREQRPRSNSLQVANVRIVVITETEGRRNSLAESARQLLPPDPDLPKYFLFGTVANMPFENPATIFERVFMRPGDAMLQRSLAGKVAQTASHA